MKGGQVEFEFKGNTKDVESKVEYKSTDILLLFNMLFFLINFFN